MPVQTLPCPRLRLFAFPLAFLLLALPALVADDSVDAAKEKATEEKATEEETLARALKKARVNGKYRMLLAQFKAAEDRKDVGEFKDLGLRPAGMSKDRKFIPSGYRVYVAPYWYVWRDARPFLAAKRSWGPEQAEGEPDTLMAGDMSTAWASRTQDDQDEWLLVEYPEPITVKEVVIHETYNPGALYRVTAFKLTGEEVEVWKGKDPTTPDKDQGVSIVPCKGSFKTNRIKIFLKSTAVPGWNEIDAVGVRNADKKTTWASAVEASSTFAQAAPPVDPRDARIRELEQEIADLKDRLKKLEALLDKKDR